jgi:hypothetical protein
MTASLVFARGGILGGTIMNEWEDALYGAHVQILDQPQSGVVGHTNGSYEVRAIPAGLCDALYFFPAYDSLVVRNVMIAADSTTVLHVTLTLAGMQGATVDTVDLMPAAPDSLVADSMATE